MHWEVLQQIGLNRNEAKIYEALLDLGEAPISAIATASTVNRRNIYDALKNLRTHNLVSVVRGKGEQRYRPADPKRLQHMINQQRQEAATVVPGLRQMYQQHLPTEQTFISRGVEGIRNFWRYVLSQNEPAYFVGGKGAWHDPRIEDARKQYFSETKKQKIDLNGIFDHEMRTMGENVTREYDPDKIRFFPPGYSTTATFDICGNRVILFPVAGERNLANVTIYNIISQPLADSYRRWFTFLWQNALPLKENQPTPK